MSTSSNTRGLYFYRYGETRTPNPFRARTSQARMYTFHHIPLYYRSEGTRTPNPRLSRLPGLSRHCIPFQSQTAIAGVPGFEPRPVDLETTMLAITNILLNKKLRSPTCGNLINSRTIKQSNYLVPTRLRCNNQLRSRLLSRRSVKLSIFIFNLYIIYKKFFGVFVFTL